MNRFLASQWIGFLLLFPFSGLATNYFVTPSGLTVVTRDYSLYENPVSADFLQPV